MPTLGERFRAAREARGLSVADVAEQVRIRSVYLQAIEEERWSEIGAPVYIRGFLRTYARFLGLEAEEIVAEFNLRGAGRDEIVPSRGWVADPDYGPVRRRFQLSPLIWIASIVAIVLVGFVVYNELTLRQPPQGPVAVASATAPASQTPIPVSPAPAVVQPSLSPLPGEHSVTLSLSGICWLRVTIDGSVRLEGTYPAGTQKTFTGKRIELRVGNAGAVDLTVDGQKVGKLGAPGQVIDRSVTS
jgi:cytoskeleton protein RodZ